MNNSTAELVTCEFTHPMGVPQTPYRIVGKYAESHPGTYHCRTWRGEVQVVHTDLSSNSAEPRTVIFSKKDDGLRAFAQKAPEQVIARVLQVPVEAIERDLCGHPIEARAQV